VFGVEPRPFARDNSGGTRAASPHLHYNEFLGWGVVEKLERGTAISGASGQWGGWLGERGSDGRVETGSDNLSGHEFWTGKLKK
jgi:hypothetical protein